MARRYNGTAALAVAVAALAVMITGILIVAGAIPL